MQTIKNKLCTKVSASGITPMFDLNKEQEKQQDKQQEEQEDILTYLKWYN